MRIGQYIMIGLHTLAIHEDRPIHYDRKIHENRAIHQGTCIKWPPLPLKSVDPHSKHSTSRQLT